MNNLFEPIFNTTAKQLQETTLVSRDTSQRWKAGKNAPKLETAIKIEEHHNISIKLWINYEKFIRDLKKDGKYKEFKKVVKNRNYENFMKSLYLNNKFKIYFED